MIYNRTVGRSYTAATAHNIAAQQHFHFQQTRALFMKAPGSGGDNADATYTTIKWHYKQTALPLCHMQAPGSDDTPTTFPTSRLPPQPRLHCHI